MKFDHTIKGHIGDRCVLIIEPNVNYRNSIKGFLTNLKITDYRFVSSVRDAQIALLTANVGLFICEWQLDGRNGVQFCREIKKKPAYQKTPFLLLSVESLRKDVILASEVGVDGYLLKPFSFEEFQETLRIVMKSVISPNQLNAMLSDGLRKTRDGDLDEAEAIFQDVLIQNPMSARALSGLGQIALQRNNIERAISLYKSAIEVNPEYVEGLRQLLELCVKHQPVDNWLPLACRAHEMSPENPKYTIILAQAMLHLKKFEQSEQFFKKTIRLSPKLAEAYKGLGRLHLIQDDYDSAMKNFKRAIDLDDSDVSLLNSLGLTYIKMGRVVEGIEKYQSALELQPKDHRILFNLGYANEKNGDLSQARFYYNEALVQNPDYTKAKRRLEMLANAS